jgi:hypothetical protein
MLLRPSVFTITPLVTDMFDVIGDDMKDKLKPQFRKRFVTPRNCGGNCMVMFRCRFIYYGHAYHYGGMMAG